MKAEYNHWYKCQEGQMPEDFEKCIDTFLVVQTTQGLEYSERYQSCYKGDYWYEWDCLCNSDVIAWMLPEPYKEE